MEKNVNDARLTSKVLSFQTVIEHDPVSLCHFCDSDVLYNVLTD